MSKLSMLLLLVMPAAASAGTLAVKWNQTPILFAGKTVAVKLADGANVRGRWVEVSPQSFTMLVEKTSKRTSHPKGLQAFDRTTVASIILMRGRKMGRVIGTTLGIFVGLGLGERIAENNPVGGRLILPVTAAVAALGYAVGSAFDKNEILVTILPD